MRLRSIFLVALNVFPVTFGTPKKTAPTQVPWPESPRFSHWGPRLVVANHKTGSSMAVKMAMRACAILLERHYGKPLVNDTSALLGSDTCFELISSTFQQKKMCGERFSQGCGGCGGTCDWACCPALPFSFEQAPFRGIAVLRDPIHLMVSQYWFTLDGHERGHGVKRFTNGTQSMAHQLSQERLFKAVGVSVQFVRRNSPSNMRMGCLEDFMKSEAAFFEMWAKAFAFLDLPIPRAQLMSSFADLNPKSTRASEATVAHSTFRDREEQSLAIAHDALRLDRGNYSSVATVMYASLEDLSRQTNCWDWETDSRGTKDAWQL